MTAPIVVGFDLSTTSTGIADEHGRATCFTPALPKHTNAGLDTLLEIVDELFDIIPDGVELVVLEGLAFDGHDKNRWLAQLAGIVRMGLFTAGIPFQIIPIGTLKKYATGSGQASKLTMIRAAEKRLGYDGDNDDEADALWLRAAGCDLLDQPIVALPKTQHQALDKLRATKPILQD